MPIEPKNNVRTILEGGGVVASMTVRYVTTPAVATLAKGCGFDTIYVDLEHSPISMQVAGDICAAALAADITPFVRVPSIGPEYISRILDAGALGIIAPHVETAEQARAVVALAKYPPVGARSEGGPMVHFGYDNPPPAQAHPIMNDAVMVVVMIETGTALDNLDALAGTEGVDMLFIGSNDLCASLGITGQFDNPLLEDAFARMIAACRKAGKHAGIGGLAGRPDLMEKYVRMGAHYVSVGSDLGFLAAGGTQAANFVHALEP